MSQRAKRKESEIENAASKALTDKNKLAQLYYMLKANRYNRRLRRMRLGRATRGK